LGLKARIFRGFATPARLAILEELRGGERTVSELVEAIGLCQPHTSAHLAYLKDRGLVEGRPEGRNVRYRLADPRVGELLRGAEGILAGAAERVYAWPRRER